jgi:hypothetical protein
MGIEPQPKGLRLKFKNRSWSFEVSATFIIAVGIVIERLFS